jgi:hypothetical protein
VYISGLHPNVVELVGLSHLADALIQSDLQIININAMCYYNNIHAEFIGWIE